MTHGVGYRKDIQGLRAFAVILVLLFHFETPIRGGYLGVDMFFVISGYVIANSTLNEINRTQKFSWSTFLHRRVRRLLPGMAVVVLSTAILSVFLLSPFGPQQETSRMLLTAATYSSNFYLMPQNYFSLDPKANPLLHLWSLAVEEQFYFIWPIVIISFLQLKKLVHQAVLSVTFWIFATFITAVSLWIFLICSIHGLHVNSTKWFRPLLNRNIAPEHFAFYSPFSRAWEFIVGVLVALFLRKKFVSSLLRLHNIFLAFGSIMITAGLFWASKNPEVQHDLSWSTNTSATLSVVGGTALWIFGSAKSGIAKQLMSNRLLCLIGDISYSVYLLHWPIWVLLITSFKQSTQITLVAFCLSIGLGWLQFHFIEEPIRLRKRFLSKKTLHFTFAFGVLSLFGFFVISEATPYIAKKITLVDQNQLSQHVIEKPCLGKEFRLGKAKSCVFSDEINKPNAVLVGDSMAKSLSDGFVFGSNAEGLNSFVFALPGCALLPPDSPFGSNEDCVNWRTDVFASLKQIQPKVLVIANLSSLYTDTALEDKTVSETQNFWGNEIARTLELISDLNTRVIIVQPPPKIDYDLRYDVSLLWRNIVKESREDVVERRKIINEIEFSTASQFADVRKVLNFTDEFCNAEFCYPKINEKFMFEDIDHLSVDGSLLIAPLLQNAIAIARTD